MINQLQFGRDGELRDKVEIAIKRLQSFEPPDGYYVAFSGGKDSQCVYHLCKLAGVKFDAHYAMTSVDPPELVRFIRNHYTDVIFERQHYTDGNPEHYYSDGTSKPITMWSLIADHTLPPTRKVRYCCASLKEQGGGWKGRGHWRSLGRKRKPQADARCGEYPRQEESNPEKGRRNGRRIYAQQTRRSDHER